MAVNPVMSSTDLHLADLMAAISLAIDIADGYPLDKSLRSAMLAVRLARELGLGRPGSPMSSTRPSWHIAFTAQSFNLAAGFGG